MRALAALLLLAPLLFLGLFVHMDGPTHLRDLRHLQSSSDSSGSSGSSDYSSSSSADSSEVGSGPIEDNPYEGLDKDAHLTSLFGGNAVVSCSTCATTNSI